MPYGLTLELYDLGAFGGAVKVVQGSMFVDSVSEEFPCISIQNDFNDEAASAIVYYST